MLLCGALEGNVEGMLFGGDVGILEGRVEGWTLAFTEIETSVTATPSGSSVKELTKSKAAACDFAELASLTATLIYKSVSPVSRLLAGCDPSKLQWVGTPLKALAIDTQIWSLLPSVAPVTLTSKLMFSDLSAHSSSPDKQSDASGQGLPVPSCGWIIWKVLFPASSQELEQGLQTPLQSWFISVGSVVVEAATERTSNVDDISANDFLISDICVRKSMISDSSLQKSSTDLLVISFIVHFRPAEFTTEFIKRLPSTRSMFTRHENSKAKRNFI